MKEAEGTWVLVGFTYILVTFSSFAFCLNEVDQNLLLKVFTVSMELNFHDLKHIDGLCQTW